MALFVGERRGYKNFVTAVSAIKIKPCALRDRWPCVDCGGAVTLEINKVSFVEYGRVSTRQLVSLYRMLDAYYIHLFMKVLVYQSLRQWRPVYP